MRLVVRRAAAGANPPLRFRTRESATARFRSRDSSPKPQRPSFSPSNVFGSSRLRTSSSAGESAGRSSGTTSVPLGSLALSPSRLSSFRRHTQQRIRPITSAVPSARAASQNPAKPEDSSAPGLDRLSGGCGRDGPSLLSCSPGISLGPSSPVRHRPGVGPVSSIALLGGDGGCVLWDVGPGGWLGPNATAKRPSCPHGHAGFHLLLWSARLDRGCRQRGSTGGRSRFSAVTL
jgi:hypothetical protein